MAGQMPYRGFHDPGEAIYDLLNPGTSMMGGDAQSQATVEDMLLGRGDQYSPGGVYAPMYPEDQSYPVDPQDFIAQQLNQQQLAGDVVPMVRPGPYRPPAPTVRAPGAQGMQSIQSMGGQQGPNLDLMSIYNILTGREVGR